MSLAGKVVLITGASKGIGKAMAERVARDGASVVVNYGRDPKPADAVVASIGKDRAVAVQADVSTVEGVDTLVKKAVDRFGRIDVVIANAGLMPMRTVANTTEADFDRTFNINVKGPYFLVQKALPYLQSGSRVIFVSTGIVHHSGVIPPYLLYGATKGAIESMTKIMAKDLGTKGILVNAIAPGPTATELFFEGKSEQMVQSIASQSPLNQIGKPEQIADVAAFLCGPDSTWVAGHILLANGAAMV